MKYWNEMKQTLDKREWSTILLYIALEDWDLKDFSNENGPQYYYTYHFKGIDLIWLNSLQSKTFVLAFECQWPMWMWFGFDSQFCTPSGDLFVCSSEPDNERWAAQHIFNLKSMRN